MGLNENKMPKVMKIVGKRKPSRGTLEDASHFLKLVLKLFEGNQLIPKGVYRFKSFEDAQDKTINESLKTKK